MKDSEYMELALMLAKNGLGWTAPNPMVGAVLVKDGEIIGQGWHEKCGEPHAERNALANCKKSPQGATLYVTLEPCCHQADSRLVWMPFWRQAFGAWWSARQTPIHLWQEREFGFCESMA